DGGCGGEGGAAASVGGGGGRARGRRRPHRFERREHALAVGLAERDEPHAGRNEVGGQRVEISLQRGRERDPVTRARNGNRNRNRQCHRFIPERQQPIERQRRPGRTRRVEEGAALRRGFQIPLLR